MNLTSLPSVAVAGPWSIAYIKLVDEYPTEGTTSEILQERLSNGGSAYNTAVNISRLNSHIPIYAVGCVGCDIDGESIVNDLRAHHISTQYLKFIPDIPTGYEDVTSVKRTGRCTIFRQNGANQSLGKELMDSDFEAISHFYFSTVVGNPEAMVKVLAQLKNKNKQIIVGFNQQDASKFGSQLLPIISQSHVALLGLNEFEKIMGQSVRIDGSIDSEILSDLSKDLMKKCGSLQKLVVYFPEGALLRRPSGSLIWESSLALPRSKTNSYYGASDAFKAGFISAHLQSFSPEISLRIAHASAAACMMDISASGGVWSIEKCLVLEQKFGKKPPLVDYEKKVYAPV